MSVLPNVNLTNNVGVERPGPRDVLFSCYSTDLNSFDHIANRRFRKYLDIHMKDFSECKDENEKRILILQMIEPLIKSQYRLMKLGKDGIFVELNRAETVQRLANCLQDAVALFRQKKIATYPNYKTREQLKMENISPMDYAESMVKTPNDNNIPVMEYWVRPRGFEDKKKNILDEYVKKANATQAAVQQAQAQAVAAAQAVAQHQQQQNNAAATGITAASIAAAAAVKKQAPVKAQRTVAKFAQQPKLPKNHIRSLDSIVISSMQQGMLPIGGNWKFFPLPELKNKVNLGTQLNGWQLKLEPISMAGEPIILDVPL